MSSSVPRATLPLALALASLALLLQCRTSRPNDSPGGASAREVRDAWGVVYKVLQHPRCLNCHPAGDRPLQGDASVPHAQNVQRGADGEGLYAMRCSTCHQEQNTPGAHMPPGAPNWHLPHPDMPLVFEGLSASELCRQLKDPARNGNKTPEQILEHVADDKLVRWGWEPGDGRAPVPVPHPAFVLAMRVWVEGGCLCP
jgi:hypothetical protein